MARRTKAPNSPDALILLWLAEKRWIDTVSSGQIHLWPTHLLFSAGFISKCHAGHMTNEHKTPTIMDSVAGIRATHCSRPEPEHWIHLPKHNLERTILRNEEMNKILIKRITKTTIASEAAQTSARSLKLNGNGSNGSWVLEPNRSSAAPILRWSRNESRILCVCVYASSGVLSKPLIGARSDRLRCPNFPYFSLGQAECSDCIALRRDVDGHKNHIYVWSRKPECPLSC